MPSPLKEVLTLLLPPILTASCFLIHPRCFGEGESDPDLRLQLLRAKGEAVENAEAWHSVAELSRRILFDAPRDAGIWEELARAQLKVGDTERCERTLVSWEESAPPLPAAASDIEGDIAFARDDYASATKAWTLYLQSKPDATATLSKLAWAYEIRGDWKDAISTLQKKIATGDSAGSRVWLARCFLRIRAWDDAYAQMDAANKLDASDEAVKAWLPRFELLSRHLPAIKALPTPSGSASVKMLLDRALLFAEANQNDLSLEDDAKALHLAPASRRALLQKGYAIIAMGRPDEAAALNMNVIASVDVATRERLLREIGDIDKKIASKPESADLVDRAWRCNELLQYALALDDTRDARKRAPAGAPTARLLLEEGFALEKMGHGGDAMKIYSDATVTDPKNATAWRYRGEAELRRANYGPAIDFLSRSLAIREAAPVLLERAKCYRATGRRAEAKWDFNRYQDLLPKR